MPTNKNDNKLVFRSFAIAKESLDTESRTFAIAFSSETPVERYDEFEILGHQPQEIRLDFLGSGRAPVLFEHDPSQQIGVVESVVVENGIGRAVVRLGKGQLATEVWNDIQDGIKGNVSVGYRVHKTQDLDKQSYRVTDWEPLEVSIVSIPADMSVGVGRSKEITETLVTTHDDKGDDETVVRDVTEESKTTIMEVTMTTEINLDEVRSTETTRVRSILSMGEKFNQRDAAQEFVATGKNVDEFRAMVLDKIETRQTPSAQPTKLDMSTKELRKYSLLTAIRAMATGDWSDAGLEREASQAIGKRLGRSTTGLYVPMDYFARSMSVGGVGTGAELVANNLLTGEYVSPLYNKLVIKALGAHVLSGLVGDIDIPTGSGVAAGWIAEDGSAGDVTPGTGLISLSPKTVAARSYITRKMLQQSSMSVEAMVRDALENSIAQAIDQAAIFGDGLNGSPKGILKTAGIGVGAGASLWHIVNNLISDVESANLAGKAFLTSPKGGAYLRTTPKVATTDSAMVMQEVGKLLGYSVTETNGVPINLGAGTNETALIFGDFSQLVIGEWGVIELAVSDSDGSTFQKGGLTVRAMADVDVAVKHAAAFSAAQFVA